MILLLLARGVEWTEKSIEVFETLTYCAQWKILMARVESNANVNGRNIYHLKLVDTNTEKVLHIFCFHSVQMLILFFRILTLLLNLFDWNLDL